MKVLKNNNRLIDCHWIVDDIKKGIVVFDIFEYSLKANVDLNVIGLLDKKK